MSDTKQETIENTCNRAVSKTRVQVNDFERIWVIENFRLRGNCQWEYINAKKFTFQNNQEKYELQLKVYSLDEYQLDADTCSPTDLEDADEFCKLQLTLERISGPDANKRAFVRLSLMLSEELWPTDGEWLIIKPKEKKIAEVEHRWSQILKCEHISKSNDLTMKLFIRFDNGDLNDEEYSKPINTNCEKSLIHDLESLLTSPRFSDFTIIVDDKQFPVHKTILAARSSVFSAMFEHDMLENKRNVVEIDDVEPETMSEMLHYIYTGSVKGIESLTVDLLMAADKYDLNDQNLMCTRLLTKDLNIASLPGILKLVDKIEHFSHLRDSALKFVTNHGKKVTNMENLNEMMQSLSPTLQGQVMKALVA